LAQRLFCHGNVRILFFFVFFLVYELRALTGQIDGRTDRQTDGQASFLWRPIMSAA